MNPAEFLPVAERYQRSGHEAERRTSIGRSYYGTFNVLIAKLSSEGVGFHENQDDHKLLANYFKTSKHLSAYKIGQNLEILRRLRNDSDYSMTLTISVTNSEFAYKLAGEVIRRFDEFSREDLSRIEKEMDEMR